VPTIGLGLGATRVHQDITALAALFAPAAILMGGAMTGSLETAPVLAPRAGMGQIVAPAPWSTTDQVVPPAPLALMDRATRGQLEMAPAPAPLAGMTLCATPARRGGTELCAIPATRATMARSASSANAPQKAFVTTG